MNFSTKLKKLRLEKKMKQQEVADKLGIARTTYASYEQGKREPDHETLIKIAEYYDVTIDFLLRGESQEALEEARRILEDPDTLVAAADGKITASILEAAQRIIAEQLKSGRQPGDIKNGNKK
ncbi:helix-turn-helix transcriptional regulator [Bacillus subtilis]|uniref:helix-turn-helix domain-containing protein n=1 Tax=Bacillus subtilis TaxID=1423 RepID=UPI00138A5F14|nr:helix-turn-helix transcriptional regulator [Bacillus subtilis]MEC2197805.1 helix-turn-helix transcriptional regulator [Bacillus subtilis]NDK00632.1 HTH-type transcriptional regulator Xre [Bacillus subtilis subsp. subtilis]WEY97182.1 helix-turn-helix transcriptional regulator [Bacillus subtilis]